jgi:DNA-binding NtrC family response regulator
MGTPLAEASGLHRLPPRDNLVERSQAYERQLIVDALDRCQGNQTLAARELGIPRRTLVRRLESYGLPRPRKR